MSHQPRRRLITRAEYKEHLANLVVDLVIAHGELTVGAVHELANSLIVRYGVDHAREHVWETVGR